MNFVFADAFYFIARINARDQFHSRALALSKQLRAPVLTTDWILTEVADALSKSECRLRVPDFIGHLQKSPYCEIVPATRGLFERGLQFYKNHADKEWSLTDCISFSIMREREIHDALTGDRHFEQAGFRALLKS